MNPTPISSTTAQPRVNEVKPAGTAPVAAPAIAAVANKPAVIDKVQLKNSVDAINRFLKVNSEVQFSIDDSSGQSVIKVVDTETHKVLRQFPSEQTLEIGKDLETKKGLLLKEIG
ncbi:flagellar biosynthesis protein FlaG [Duganella sp. BJB488]|uniref:flagellar protein FlaG n=1 Tax=unclassified Duganella TaxID=2636909 RepID=UPI000E35339C|nr:MULTISPECIES: flagellar protein FlaG [unclassified Duganella]RFP08501.1 flagellar biosynthesis protein FlaG [Duganella sp. BJB489]RFP10936.1 flagellar biosynthesis protein FlaG [Duganella sp. BJB488]RFP27851.1 flagellar biosynthesis protein FlaG [Duganella sp. BJB480]